MGPGNWISIEAMQNQLRVSAVLVLPLTLLMLLGAGAASAAIEPLESYGIAGDSGPGGVAGVQGMGVDPISGKVVLADSGNNRIAVFTPGGQFVRAFGKNVVPGGGSGPEVCTTSCQEGENGDAAGELDGILESEVSPNGRIYVSEESNSRISVFKLNGAFLFAFGDDVDPAGLTGPEVCTDQCQTGQSGAFGGSFAQPWASSFGPDGDFYVANTDNSRVDRFTPAGDHVYGFGKDVNVVGGDGVETCVTDVCQVGDAGGGPGSLPRPEGIDFGADRRIWIGSWDGIRANVFTPEPDFLRGFGTDVVPGGTGGFEVCRASCQNGSQGSDAGEFSNVQGVAVDAAGTAYVADAGNNRVNAYNSSSDFLFTFGIDVKAGGGSGFEVCRTNCSAGEPADVFDNPYPLHVDCRGTIYEASDDTGEAGAFGDGKAKPGPCRLKLKKPKAKKDGTARIKALTPYAGKLTLKGKGVKRNTARHRGLEGNERLKIKAKGSLKRKLERQGRAKTKVTVTLNPTDGNVKQSKSRRVKLKLG